MIKRVGVKPQDRVVEKGFRRLEQSIEEIENQQYTPKKDLIPGNNVNLGSEKKRFNKVYTKELITDGSTLRIGDIEFKQNGKGDDATVNIVNRRTNNNAFTSPTLKIDDTITEATRVDGGGKHLFITTVEDDGLVIDDVLTIEDGNTLEFISLWVK